MREYSMYRRRLYINITVGSLDASDIHDVFYDPTKRRLFQVTMDGSDYSMKLVEDISERKKLLFENGILSNPYGFDDIVY